MAAAALRQEAIGFMASYWRSVAVAGVLSLIVGGYEGVQSLIYYTSGYALIPSVEMAAYIAAVWTVFTFGSMTTVQAVWQLFRRQKGTAGRLLITAGAQGALIILVAITPLLLDAWGYAGADIWKMAIYAPISAALIATGILLIRLDRRQKLAATPLAPEMGSEESEKWPPLPG